MTKNITHQSVNDKKALKFSHSEAQEKLDRIVAIHEHEGANLDQSFKDKALKILKGEINIQAAIEETKKSIHNL